MVTRRGLFTLIVCFFFAGTLLAQTSSLIPLCGAPKTGPMKVVRIMDEKGALSYEVIDDEIIRLMKEDLNDRFRKAKHAWSAARDAWKVENPDIAFPMPKPVNPKLKVLKKGFNSRSEAEGELALARGAGPFCIYQVDLGGKKSYKVITCEEVTGRKFRVEKDYADALIAWIARKKAFVKDNAGQDFSEKMPAKPKFRVLKNRIKTIEKANLQMARYIK